MIKAENINKSYGSLQVLKNLNLEIIEGETLVILGRSGVGKSVLLKLLMGLEQPDSGDVFIQEKSILNVKEKDLFKITRSMGMLFQSGALFDSMNVEENVGFYLQHNPEPSTNKRLTEEEIQDRVEEALKMVGLSGTNKKIPSQLSGGMRKRAALARLIAYRPSIYLYDEPTTGLDPITAQQINELILMIQQKFGATSIVVTHDIPSALYVANRLALHEEGHLPIISPINEFIKNANPTIQEFLNYHTPSSPIKDTRS
jgi:phospholipid/cholesterol/gamma-HCH transport system ATP-binding protein